VQYSLSLLAKSELRYGQMEFEEVGLLNRRIGLTLYAYRGDLAASVTASFNNLGFNFVFLVVPF